MDLRANGLTGRVVAAAAVLAVAAACGGSPPRQAAPKQTPTPSPSAKTRAAAAAPPVCPLTGTAPPAGHPVPNRPAVAVKIGNDPAALPQSGLDKADIVFEEPIEGAITRLVAVFQCYGAVQVGPIRSTRWVDSQVLPRFDHPGFAFAGGINPDIATIQQAPLVALDALNGGPAFFRTSGRYPPENLYTSTAALWQLMPQSSPKPPPLFTYSRVPPAGVAAGSVALGWSSYYTVTWIWDPTHGRWARVEYGSPDVTADGVRITAVNVVVMKVRTYAGPYAEDSSGEHGIRSVLVGSGPALVLRGGKATPATWVDRSLTDPLQLISPSTRQPLSLAPGNTWVELVPLGGSVTVG